MATVLSKSPTRRRRRRRRRILRRKDPFSLSALLLQTLQVLLLLACVYHPHHHSAVDAAFNTEVEKRVLERIDDFLNGPMIANGLTSKFRSNGGFPHDMDARDRDAYLRFEYSLLQEIQMDMLYFGLEDGTFAGHGIGWGTYREPANSGYDVEEPRMQKYFQACVNRETGAAENCTMSAGSQYIQCIRNCAFMKCPDEETQACSNVIPGITELNDPDKAHCHYNHTTKWCRQYEIIKAPEEPPLGFVPRTYHCHDAKGVFTQEPGVVVKGGFLQSAQSPDLVLGDCTYEDGVTKVQRTETADYAYCNGEICDNAFHGGFRSRDYDPRYRDWYILTRENQIPNWSPPYPFFSNLDLGITYSHPIYSTEEASGRNVFEGVLAVDYTFADISNFLVESYQDSSTVVVVFEAQEPDNFMVASSTGRKAASKVLTEDPTQPCSDDANDTGECIVIRKKMKELDGSPMDSLLVKAFRTQKAANYPKELLSFKTSDLDDLGEYDENGVYIVQSTYYNPGGELEWIILVISPAGKGTTDYLTKDDSLFGVVCVVASLGFVLCLAMFFSFYRQRNERAIILADWRFTSAFLLGCALLNLSSFTLLGENTDALCLSRMWSFHFLLAVALSPLFVKVWRMWRMVGAINRRPTIVNHTMATLLSLPIIAIQVFILVIVTLVDPPHQEESIDLVEGIVTQRVVCEQDSAAFSIVEIIFEAGLVLIGCVLAYITRNLDSQFGEAKQLMFSMYNIALIGIITTVIVYTMDIDRTGQIILTSIGVFWGTVFSSAAFVLPRLMRVQNEKKYGSSLRRKTSNGVQSNNRDSKVRFSLQEEHKSSIASVEGSHQQKWSNSTSGTDKKSNQTPGNNNSNNNNNNNNNSDSKPGAYDKKTQPLPVEAPMIGTGWTEVDTPSAAEQGSEAFSSGPFDKGTGWSVFEKCDPNASVGAWSDSASTELKGSSEMKEPQQSSPQHEVKNTTPMTIVSSSDQFPLPSEEFNMSTIREGGSDVHDDSDNPDPLV